MYFRICYGFNYESVLNEASKIVTNTKSVFVLFFSEKDTPLAAFSVVKTMKEGRVAHERSTFD